MDDAPGEGQHPLSLYQDKDAECFPAIFCGQTPPSRDERLVPVYYSDIVKWEWVMFQFMFVHYTLSSVWVSEWPPFVK